MIGRKGPGRRGWLAGLVAGAVAGAGVCSAALLGAMPAQASAGCSIHYWWTPFNSPSSWVDAVITDGAFSCTTSPVIARFDGGTDILAPLQDQSGYRTERNIDGSPYWEAGGIYHSPGILGAPSLISHSGSDTEYAYPLGNGVYGNDLWYGWLGPGYHDPPVGQVSAGTALAPRAPGMARTSTATEIAATGVDYSLWFYWNSDGDPYWGSEQITGIWKAADSPSITADDSATEISAIAPDGSLWFYWAVNGTSTWHPEEVAGPGSATAGQSMTHSDGAIQIAATAPDGSLWFYWAADGTSTWHAERIAGPGSVSGTPSMIGAASAMEIAATGADGSLWFYWAADGTPTWHPVLLSGPGTTWSSPDMVASGGTFEIASLTQ